MSGKHSTYTVLRMRFWWVPLLLAILPTITREWADELRPRKTKR